MTLEFTGIQTIDSHFQHRLEAMDGTRRVAVIVSSEAMHDKGLPSVQEKAREKYAAGIVDGQGHVIVLTADFAVQY